MEIQVKKCLQHHTALRKTLGEKYPVYIGLVLSWIRRKMTRSELDIKAYGMLVETGQALHYDFLTCLSHLCWGLSSLRIDDLTVARVPSQECSDHSLREPHKKQKLHNAHSLPGIQLIRARLYIAAWNSDLKTVDPKVGHLLLLATKNFLKDILQAAILHKRPSAGKNPIDAMDVWLALQRNNRDRPISFGFQDSSVKTL